MSCVWFCDMRHVDSDRIVDNNGNIRGWWVTERCGGCGVARTKFFIMGQELPYGINPWTGKLPEK